MKVSVRKKTLYTDHEKYANELLCGHIHFEDIPICALRGMHCASIYMAVFRLDRSISKEQFREHLDFLRDEVTSAWQSSSQSGFCLPQFSGNAYALYLVRFHFVLKEIIAGD